MSNRGLRFSHMLLARMRLPGPEETTQAVLLFPGHNMDMQVRNALADAIIDGNEGAVGAHAFLDGASEQLHVGEERSY